MQEASRWKMVAVSVALHALVGTLLWLLPARLIQKVDESDPIDIVFFSPDEVKPAPTPPPPEPLIADNEIPEVVPEPVTPDPLPPPVPVRPERRPPEPFVARVEMPEPKPTPKPKVRTNVFAENRPTPNTRSRPNPAVATIGGFNPKPTEEPIGRADTRVVSAASFGGNTTHLPAQGKPASRRVATTGFAGQVAVASRPSSSGSVKQGGFGDGVVAARKTTARRRPTANPDQPVEVLSKVKPIYTDEARQMRIEGEVVLEVTFVASGRLRVLRVVGGLGHGLDEAAIEAAEKIRFKPARRDGRPVDHTATLRVVFRLA